MQVLSNHSKAVTHKVNCLIVKYLRVQSTEADTLQYLHHQERLGFNSAYQIQYLGKVTIQQANHGFIGGASPTKSRAEAEFAS